MELVRVAENQVNVTQMQVDRIQKEVDAGSRPMGDLYDIEAQLAREEQSLVAAENNLISSKLQLAQLLMLDDYESFEIKTPEMEMKNTVLLSMSPTEIYQKSLENQPQIESAELNVQSAEYGVGIAKSAYYPSLRMNGSISTGASDRIADPFRQQWEENFSENLVFSLNIPIYSRRQIKSNVNRSQLNYRNSQLNLKQEKYNLLQNIQTAYNDAKAAFNKYKADEKTVLSLRESFKYVEERYNVGLINAYEYNLSKNQLTAAESEMIRDKFDYIFKLMILEFYYANEISL
jgi:outer membrane protein